MRTFAHLMIILLLISFSTTSCKKEYPSDTPKWLKTKIKEAKKEMKKEAKYGEPFSRYVSEMSNGTGEYIYLFNTRYLPKGLIIIYNQKGEILCSQFDSNSIGCPQYTYNSPYSVVRVIWTSN